MRNWDRGKEEQGAVTAEFAFVLTALMLVAVLLAAAGSAVMTHTRVADAARVAARLAALEAPAGEISSAVAQVAGPGAAVSLTTSGGWATATVTAPVTSPVGWFAPDAVVTARIPLEPVE